MGFLIVIAAVSVGLAVFVLLTQMAVRNGIRMSGLIDWKTQYELERMEDAGGSQKPLAELYKSVAESEDDADKVERKVKEQALKYINSRNSTHVTNAWIFLGLGIVGQHDVTAYKKKRGHPFYEDVPVFLCIRRPPVP